MCADGHPHRLDESVEYHVPFNVPYLESLDGWAWCVRCDALIRDPSGGPSAPCNATDREHSLGNPFYRVPFTVQPADPPPPPPPPPAPLSLVITERPGVIIVEGRNFTPHGPAIVTFRRNADFMEYDMSVDETGGIYLRIELIDPRPEGGDVAAFDRDSNRVAPGATRRSFPKVTHPVTID